MCFFVGKDVTFPTVFNKRFFYRFGGQRATKRWCMSSDMPRTNRKLQDASGLFSWQEKMLLVHLNVLDGRFAQWPSEFVCFQRVSCFKHFLCTPSLPDSCEINPTHSGNGPSCISGYSVRVC